jgi:Holliday junction DNA helicase RuvA
VGARTALAVLSGLSVSELVEAVVRQETGRLTKIPGIGKKTAERLLLELKDKLGAEANVGLAGPRAMPVSSDVLHALVALGYNEREALAAMKTVAAGASVADGIKQALKTLSKA